MDTSALAPFDVAAIPILLAAGFGYANHRFFKLPSAVGLTLMGGRIGGLINRLGQRSAALGKDAA